MSNRSVWASALIVACGCATSTPPGPADGAPATAPVPGMPPPPTSDSPAVANGSRPPRDLAVVGECEKYFGAAMAAARQAAKAFLRCSTDADCAITRAPGTCGIDNGCGSGVRAADLERSTAAQVAAQKPHCDAWETKNCPTLAPPPVPSCQGYRARCVGGACTEEVIAPP